MAKTSPAPVWETMLNAHGLLFFSPTGFRYNHLFSERPGMLRYFTAGESHGEALVAVLSGLPAGLGVDQSFIDRELWRRQQGFGRGGRMKIEKDTAHI
ncbi:MAG TPA: chorismate synthase, partial [Candidatus Angelobacter sp.]